MKRAIKIIRIWSADKIELIFIDGMSKDDSWKILEDFKNSNHDFYDVVLLKNPKVILSAGMNVGIKAARGECILKVDCHSHITDNFIENNVKIIATANSPFVYLFDKENQTFTVYESSPTKTHENYKTSFKLYYMFRFKFDLSAKNNRIIDVTIPENTGDRPELYLLSSEGVNKINLYDFIDSLKNNKNLKAVSEAE